MSTQEKELVKEETGSCSGGACSTDATTKVVVQKPTEAELKKLSEQKASEKGHGCCG